MSENLYSEGNKITNQNHIDGWYRTFQGYPEMNADMWERLQAWKNNPTKLLLFFTAYVTNDLEYANFLTHDLITGIWNG